MSHVSAMCQPERPTTMRRERCFTPTAQVAAGVARSQPPPLARRVGCHGPHPAGPRRSASRPRGGATGIAASPSTIRGPSLRTKWFTRHRCVDNAANSGQLGHKTAIERSGSLSAPQLHHSRIRPSTACSRIFPHPIVVPVWCTDRACQLASTPVRRARRHRVRVSPRRTWSTACAKGR